MNTVKASKYVHIIILQISPTTMHLYYYYNILISHLIVCNIPVSECKRSRCRFCVQKIL